jgi:hypothetical protein
MFHAHLSSGAGTVSQLVAGVPSGLHKTKENCKKQEVREELIAYFLLIRHGPHRKRHIQQLLYGLLNKCTSTVNANLY